MAITKHIDISKFGKGALEKPLSRKDYRLEVLAKSSKLQSEYIIEYKGKIKNQGDSSSCVGQALSYYASLLNFMETGNWTELSARFIYSKIFQPEGGAYIDDGLKVLMNDGIGLEEDVPSYENGKEPSEKFMRKHDDISYGESETAKQFLIKKYFTWENTNVEWYKQAIVQGHGSPAISWGNNILWSLEDIVLPDNRNQMAWLHCILFVGWSDKKKAFKIINSWDDWGDKGFGWLPYSYVEKGYVTNPKTMIDVPNDTYVKLTSQVKNLSEMVRLFQIIINLKNKIVQLLKGRVN